MDEKWPYVAIDLELFAHTPLDANSSYRMALSADGISTIEYNGNDRAYRAGGYDICCGFVNNSLCPRGSFNHTQGAEDAKAAEMRSPPRSPGEDSSECSDLFDPRSLEELGSLPAHAATGTEATPGSSPHSGALRTCEDFALDGFCDLAGKGSLWYREKCRKSCGLCSTDNPADDFANVPSTQPPSPGENNAPTSSSSSLTDCPLVGRFSARLVKPLHLRRAGTWSAVVLVASSGLLHHHSDGDDDDEDSRSAPASPPASPTVSCASVVFNVSFAPEPPDEEDELAEASSPPRTSSPSELTESADSSNRPPADGSPPAPPHPPTPSPENARFERVSTGKVCSDGADLLEGPVDSYTDCDERSRLCKKTRKCAAKCKRNKRCFFYTTFQSGWCQLSSRCEDQVASSDKSAQTYARTAQ